MKLKIGETFRLSTPNLDNQEYIDNYKNYIFYTNAKNFDKTFRPEKGIHTPKRIKAIDGDRLPVIIITSSQHKSGSDDTPWKDRFDPDNGIVNYYGDAKPANKDPLEPTGNRAMMDEWRAHTSSDINERLKSTPIVFFERAKKGYMKFAGVGVLEKVSLVTQKIKEKEFTNFEYEFCVLDLNEENNYLDWDWISDRCNKNLAIKDTNKNAPTAWKKWIKNGNDKIEQVRRHVIKSRLIKEKEQYAKSGSVEEKILKTIEKHYEPSNKKLQFELFALYITQFFFIENNMKFLEGYITKGSGDKGIDFISRIDIGQDLASIKMVVIGQAKCQSDTINSKDIARTIAKLKRNYIGVFVTNSVFSTQTQEEILEDQYPLIMINGNKIAQLTNKYILDNSADLNQLEEYLNNIDKQYESYKSNIRPDDIVYK